MINIDYRSNYRYITNIKEWFDLHIPASFSVATSETVEVKDWATAPVE